MAKEHVAEWPVTEQQRDALIAQRKELAHKNAVSERIIGFSATVGSNIDQLDFDLRQKLLRLVVDQVRVQGWRVDISLHIPPDNAPDPPNPKLSSIDRLRSVDRDECRKLSSALRTRDLQSPSAGDKSLGKKHFRRLSRTTRKTCGPRHPKPAGCLRSGKERNQRHTRPAGKALAIDNKAGNYPHGRDVKLSS